MHELLGILLIVTIAIHAITAWLILRARPLTRPRIWFGVTIIATGLWTVLRFFGDVYFNNIETLTQARFFSQTVLIPATFVPGLFLTFCLSFLKKERWIKARHVALYLLPAIIISLLSFTDYNTVLVSTPTELNNTTGIFMYEQFGALYIYFEAYYLLVFGASFVILFLNILRTTGRFRSQLAIILVCTFISSITIILTIIAAPGNSDSLLVLANPVYSLLFTVGVAYTIIRHQFLDIRLTIRKGAVYSTLIVIVLGIFFAGLATTGLLVTGNQNPTTIAVAAISIIVVVLLYAPLKRFLQRGARKIIFPKVIDEEQFVERSRDLLQDAESIDVFLKESAALVKNFLQVDRAEWTLCRGGRALFSNGEEIGLACAHALQGVEKVCGMAPDVQTRFVWAVPATFQGEAIACLWIGPRSLSDAPLSKQEQELLCDLAILVAPVVVVNR